MKKAVNTLDAFILKCFTKFAHRFQKITGRTNYFLAKIGLAIVVAAVSVAILGCVLPILTEKVSPIFAFICGLIAIAEISRMAKLDRAEKDAIESSEVRVKHFISENSLVSRMIWVFFSVQDTLILIFSNTPITIWRIFLYSASTGLLIYYYFIAVDPLPPGKSKVKEFFEAITTYLSPTKVAGSEAQR